VYIKVFNYFIHTPFFLLALMEFLGLMLAAYAGVYLRFFSEVAERNAYLAELFPKAVIFAIVLLGSGVAMRIYSSWLREGFTGMMLRTVVSYFLLGIAVLTIFYYLIPEFYLGRGVLAISGVLAFILVMIIRHCFSWVVDKSELKRRVLILGVGEKARQIVSYIEDTVAKNNIEIIGFAKTSSDDIAVIEGNIFSEQDDLLELTGEKRIMEIVVAVDERRSREGGGFPIASLLDCKLAGVNVIEGVSFCERELDKIELGLIDHNWMVFTDGFQFNSFRDFSKRVFDIAVSLLLLIVAWPVMLLMAVAVWVESGRPVLYKQTRVGHGGRCFQLIKFRSMRTDAEKDGVAVWASKNDDRVTRVGRFMRSARIDELPQLYNVLKGEMSFVGPRPERPEFVKGLAEKIPHYNERHRVKPGIIGWAQLCYPYGASEEDAVQKLQYDLFYVKNHSLMLDMITLVQTVEVILVGDGVR